MRVTDIVLDAVAEIAALEQEHVGASLALGLEEVIFALSADAGISREELRANLEHRILQMRAEQAKLRLIMGG